MVGHQQNDGGLLMELLALKLGDQVEITYCGRTVDGFVVLASDNYQSLMLEFDCGLWGPDGMFAGMMPVSWSAVKGYYDIVQCQTVLLNKKAALNQQRLS